MLTKTYAALADSTRQKILQLLKKREMTAGEINKHFPITAPSLSHHLNTLKQADLIQCRRNGQELIYSINTSVFEEVADALIAFFSKKKDAAKKKSS